MTLHPPDRPRRLSLIGLPHPLTHALASWVRDVLAACDHDVEVELVTNGLEVVPGETALHLRPDAVAGLGLVASLEHVPGSGAAFALAARLDERWRGLPRLSVERAMASPAHAVATLASCLRMPITADMLAVADAALPALRAAVAAFGHPLAFWLALDPSMAQADAPVPAPDGLVPAAAVRLDGVDGEPVSEVLAGIRPLLPSRVDGREQSPAAAARVAARVAAGGAGWEGRVFVLAGERWAALSAGEP